MQGRHERCLNTAGEIYIYTYIYIDIHIHRYTYTSSSVKVGASHLRVARRAE